MEIKFFDDKVEQFIDGLEKSTIAKVLRTIDFLSLFGQRLGMPHSKSVGGKLFELRIRGIQEVRLIYTFHKKIAVILHGFTKKSQKIPKKEIYVANQKLSTLDMT